MAESNDAEHSHLIRLRHNVPSPLPRQLQNKRLCQLPIARQTNSKEANLVILWVYLTATFSYSLYDSALLNSNPLSESLTEATVVGLCVIAVLSPLAGFAAGVHYGTHKVMRVGLWLMWIGGIACALILMVHSLFSAFSTVPFSVSLLIAVTISAIGFSAFVVNSIPFGLDQLPDASAEQIAAFVHWYSWAYSAGITTAQVIKLLLKCLSLDSQNCAIIMCFMSAIVSSIALCLDFAFHRQLIIEPHSKNPVKTVFRVLKFAAQHKQPVRRSAFTYCEDEMPSRLDLAKSKYGGPFITEEVEDVKTCLRMTVITVVIGVISVMFFAFRFSLQQSFPSEFSRANASSQCYDSLTEFSSYNALWVTIILLFHEVVIYPVFRRWVPTTLKRSAIALVPVTISSVVLLVTSTIWYELTDSGECMFTADNDHHSPLPIDHSWIEIPTAVLTAVSCAYVTSSILEFVCAQAPYNLRGLLVGMVFSALLSGVPLGAGINSIWKFSYNTEGERNPSCNVWFYLFSTVTTTLLHVVWCALVRWYKNRERDEPDRGRIFVENYYDHYCRLGNSSS